MASHKDIRKTLTREDLVRGEIKSSKAKMRLKQTVIRMTSGTSGKPVMIFHLQDSYLSQLAAVGVKKQLTLVSIINLRLSSTVRALYASDSTVEYVFAPDYDDLNEHISRLMSDFQPDGIASTAGILIEMLRWIEKESIGLKGVKASLLGGEVPTKSKLVLIKKKMPHAVIHYIYGTAETGVVASLCPESIERPYYHPIGDTVIDIVNTNSDGVGEVVISGGESDFERYKVGDLGRFRKATCSCGNPVAFELIGRTSADFIRMAGGTLRREEFERVAQELNDYIKDFHVSVSEVISRDTVVGSIVIKIIPTQKLLEEKDPKEIITEKFTKRLFLTPSQTLSQLISQGFFLPLSIELKDSLSAAERESRMQLTQE